MYRLLAEGRTEAVSPTQVLEALEQAHSHPDVSVQQLEGALGLTASDANSNQKARHFWQSISPSITSKLAIPPGPAILVDSHLVTNLSPSTIDARDITALVEYEAGQTLPSLIQALHLLRPNLSDLPPHQRQNLIFASLSVLNGIHHQAGSSMFTSKAASRSGLPEQLGTGDHVFEVGNRAEADVRITVLLDPLSEAAQRWSSVLLMLRELEGVYARVILNPQIKLRELPLKRFYRFSAPRALKFSEGRVVAPELRFFDMPEDAVLTLGLDAPAPWLTMPMEAVYDLDNIRLADVPSGSRGKGVKAVYELKHLLIEGHAREERAGSAVTVPRGLQLLLETPDEGTRLDTIVMANLAYFQFKAQPGLWKLRIRGGRSDELYEMQSVGSQGWNSPTVEVTGQHVVLDTLSGGHLYERMTYIMILSVVKHTSSTVKFWFIENFLSPSFKEFIPHLAVEYGFEYELVTYAWPHWLRSQTEKQRTIWGYKILFLDTLFPLDLGKVIFVDADQVVRTDLQELVDLDLEGHVYGYPPMGDDSEDMDGFRFWKQGYWKDYLRGRPYHISALYVVDLHRFRLFAAGDRLRGQYQALSADPNSLSNLDQDLPNNMQSSLPIFTLPKEWLWCETWCSNDWLDRAKTIDLCSNPKTKEPKLERAKRQIPEWTVYDGEVGRLAQRLVEEKVGKSVVAPDSQVETKSGNTQQQAADANANADAHVHDEL
ncbi:hypothetical protein [Sporisorium scitamineum]|uniref:Glucosyltransferase 24 catalytic domain-containing protein n=1 Tax=Sporisorium scitamineum TaxID=49012 RepID=A0A0F7S0T8_9BASI|nr:hypothetical protein [Sporisorium scitamineum]